jgi:hypothetical protein
MQKANSDKNKINFFMSLIVKVIQVIAKGMGTKMAWPLLCAYLRGVSGNGTPTII